MSAEVHDISKIEFGILSADEIRNMAVCQIDSPKMVGPGTVYDERMGYILDTNTPCVTCGLKKDCWGHFGYIDLSEPVLHPMYYKIIVVFLKCFCKKCYRLLMTSDQLELAGLTKGKGERRFSRILEKLEKTNICSHCSAPQPKIIYKSKDMLISMEYKQKKKEATISIVVGVDEIKKIFDSVLDEDVALCGLNPSRVHPKNLILTVFPVIPPCCRPYVITDGNICDDDLTYQYIEIIKNNNQLAPQNELEEGKRDKAIQSLKFRIQTLMNNSAGRAKHPTDSRPLKGLKERLAGKSGRIRNNLMGKRVDYSARTVIGADPTLKLNQLGIPREIARIHTKPEVVTPFNIDWLTELVNTDKANFLTTTKKGDPTVRVRHNLQYAMYRRGTELLYGDIIVRASVGFNPAEDENGNVILPSKLPKGVELIPVQTGNEKLREGDQLIRNGKFIEATTDKKKRITLKIGDVVERQLQKGDIVLFNRQPTLHRGSMLAMEVVPMPFKTFRFNLAATKSFNADFDGDEMNVHAPQSFETEAELRILPSVEQHIITAQESKPIITITQDSLVAAFLMTRRKFKLTRSQFFDITMKGERVDGSPLFNAPRVKNILRILKEHGQTELYNGRGLVSLILPDSFNYQKENKGHPDEPVVKIKQGVFLEGALDKSVLGSAQNSIIQLLNKEYGAKITANFIDNIQFLGNAWLLVHGYSIGLEDCMVTSDESVMAIKDTIAQCYTKAEGIEETTQNPGIREVRVTAALSQAKDIGMKIAKEAMKPDNNFLVSTQSGAKGDFFNLAQITGLLGQQNLECGRVKYSMSHGRRSLPHYPFEGLSKERQYESRGFVRNSFIHGLSPEEFFFHAMSGREGVCDTALSTARSGYIQRKIVKLCEDIKVQNDRTARDATGQTYQFAYGETGYDATKTVRQTFCDISRLADRLNTIHEEGLTEEDIEDEPDVQIEEVESEDRQKKAVQDLELAGENELDEIDEQVPEDADEEEVKKPEDADEEEPKVEEDDEEQFVFGSDDEDFAEDDDNDASFGDDFE